MNLPAFKENLVFFREFLSEFENTGSMWPTSPLAAAALTAPLRESNRTVEILELGPGTGPVTVRILKDMHPNDCLTICEINPRLMAALRANLSENADYQRHKDRVRFFECAAQELPKDRKYDVVVCALPFLNFDLQTVRQIFDHLFTLCHPATVMTNYEYIGLRSINKTFSSALGKNRIHQIDSYLQTVYKARNVRRTRIWRNMLPINVYRLNLGQVSAGMAA